LRSVRSPGRRSAPTLSERATSPVASMRWCDSMASDLADGLCV
jgi:hypothetical protein